MINFTSRVFCLSEDSAKLCVTSSPSIVCLFTSVTIASSSIAEYSKTLQDDQENLFLIRTLVLLGISGITSGIISMSNCLQIIFQLSSSSICLKIQKIWQTLIVFLFTAGIVLENLAINSESNRDRLISHLLNAEIALGVLVSFTILMHIGC